VNQALLDQAWALSRRHHGRRLGLYLPGMFVYDGRRGRFPAVSLTGSECALGCGHCRGQLLAQMAPAVRPGQLLDLARRAKTQGHLGLLVSGGCDQAGRLPWAAFADDLAAVKAETGLFLAVHAGFVDPAQARSLKAAGVDLALLDVIGDDDTARRVYNLPGRGVVEASLAALVEAGLDLAPHVVVGLDFGRLKGEEAAVELIAASGAGRVIFVVLMPLAGTAMTGLAPPEVEDVAGLICRARLAHPELVQHLGCAKPRGAYHRRLDRLAVRAGVNHLAIPAPAAVDLAGELGLEPAWAETCCALGLKGDAS
jgi:uncharacterized radical SAM superfamily protein